MGIANSSGLASANTTFLAAHESVLALGPQGVHPAFAEIIKSDGLSVELDMVTAFPRAREWTGAKQIKDLRAYTQTINLTTYESSISLRRTQVEYDKSGAVSRALTNFAGQSAYWYDDILIAALVANTWTGYDGVTLLNDSHPNSNSTGDNLSTVALSFAQKKAAVLAMESFADEDGRPLGMFPTHLLVGPTLRQTAMEVTGSDRPVYANNTGAEAASAVVVVNTLPNYVGGDIQVVVSPFITGNQYFFMDLSKGAKPCVMLENRAPEAIEITDMNSAQRYFNDEYHFAIEADIKPAAGLWQCVYGSVTA